MRVTKLNEKGGLLGKSCCGVPSLFNWPGKARYREGGRERSDAGLRRIDASCIMHHIPEITLVEFH